MEFKVRPTPAPQWIAFGFFLALTLCFLVFSVAGAEDMVERVFGLGCAVFAGLASLVIYLLRDSPVLKIERDLITSHYPVDNVQRVAIRDGDRLQMERGVLYVVRGGSGERVRVKVGNRIRLSDWAALRAEIERRWPTEVGT